MQETMLENVGTFEGSAFYDIPLETTTFSAI
jgi:hypothetical protein